MKSRNKIIVAGTILLFFIIGLIIFLHGVKNGREIAAQLTRPAGAMSWTTSEIQTNLVSYGICMFGGLWILVSHVFLILFIAKNYIFNEEKKL